MSLVMNGKCCHRSDILVRFCLKNCQRSILPFRCLHHRQAGFLPGRVAAIDGLYLVALLTQQCRCALPTRFAALVHVAIGDDKSITWNFVKSQLEWPPPITIGSDS